MDWNTNAVWIWYKFFQLLSTRRVWIEISCILLWFYSLPCYSPHGEYGLKWYLLVTVQVLSSYSPHGEYGLKFEYTVLNLYRLQLLSTRRVWIEMSTIFKSLVMYICYSPHGEYGLKFFCTVNYLLDGTLLSTRRVWIEILDRNFFVKEFSGYSPHGEYGLK